MKKFFSELVSWIALFGIFVPFGYLPIFWALPVSIGCFIVLTGKIAEEYNMRKEENI
jgi:hypothetical protein